MAKVTNGKKLRGLLQILREKFGPLKIILFGSRARGDHLKGSDYDLLIVSSSFEKFNFRERIQKVYELLDEPLPLDAICLTPAEFKRKREEIGIVRLAVREGIEM